MPSNIALTIIPDDENLYLYLFSNNLKRWSSLNDYIKPNPREQDTVTLEMIIVVILITLHDLLLSNILSLPLVLRYSKLAQLRALDMVASGLEFWVPVVFSISMLILWLVGQNVWVHRVAIVFLAWVAVRLVIKVALVVYIIVSRPDSGVSVLLKDVMVMWLVNFLLFGVWYWIIDGGGPDVRRYHSIQRYDFGFPQRIAAMPG